MEDAPQPLSDEVRDFIRGLDEGFVEMYPEDGPRMLEIGYQIGVCLKVAREEFSDHFVAAVEELMGKHPDIAARSLDSIYVNEMVNAVPAMVERTLKLAGLVTEKKPPNIVNEYLREATRTYIFGFPQASIALSRAVLEQAVKNRAKDTPDSTYLKSWIDLVAEERKMDPRIVALAHNVNRIGNRVLHAEIASLSDAFDALASLRRFLTELYDGLDSAQIG
ncbi:MAG TPA: DUF4145 domain-containing protein [Terracidiphilus sp.]|nr:DUF4145 domain-containing protein [Terracidiphilus sp.]